MKQIKKFEDITTVNNSDLDGNWDPKQYLDNSKYTGTKNLNKNVGTKVLEVFNSYGFFIDSFGPGNWLNDQKIVLEPEKNLREFRCLLGLRDTWENFLEGEYLNNKKFKKLDKEEQKRLKEEFGEGGNLVDTDLKFSVFLPNGVRDIESGLADALEYLRLVRNSIPEMYEKPIIEDNIKHNVDEFKKFINNKGIKITNNNIEDVPMIDYRLYKDSKFFWDLKDTCDNHNIDYEDLINDLLNI